MSRFPPCLQQRVYDLANLDKEMDFALEPNSIWVGFPIKNETCIQNSLPPGLKLSSVKLFVDSEPKKRLFFNYFSVNSTYLQGHRLEIVTVARDAVTNQRRFVILDYLSDTISSDPIHPFKRPNAKNMGLLEGCDVLGAYVDEKYLVMGEKSSQKRRLSSEFAIGCNRNIFYSSKTNHLPNYMTFDEEAIRSVNLLQNTNVIMNVSWIDTINHEHDIAFFFPQQLQFKIQTNKIWSEDGENYN